MPMTHAEILELRKATKKLWEDATPHVQVLKDPSATEGAKADARERFDALDAQIEANQKRVEAEEKLIAEAAADLESDAERSSRHAALEKLLGQSAGRIIREIDSPEGRDGEGTQYRVAFQDVLRHGAAWCKEHRPGALRAIESKWADLQKLAQEQPVISAVISSGVDSSMGYMVPQEPVKKHLEAQKFNGGLFGTQISRLRTKHGRDIPYTLEDDTDSEGEYVQESKSHAGGEVPEGRRRYIRAHTCSSKIVRVPVQLIQDMTGEEFETHIFRRFGKRINRRRNRAVITGTGNTHPHGILKRIHVGHTTAPGQTNTLLYRDFLLMEDALDVLHQPGAEMLFSSKVLTTLKLETDNDNRPLWQPSVAVGQPATYNGYPYKLDSYMPTLGPGNIVVAFGQFDSYVFREVTKRFLVTFRERFMEFGEVGYLMFERHDGDLMDAGDHPLIGLQMAEEP